MELQNVLNNRRSMRNYDAAKRLQRSRLKQLSMRRYWLLHGRIYRHQDITAFYQMKIEEFRQKCLPEFNQKNAEERHLL